jgi:hypothetical protein
MRAAEAAIVVGLTIGCATLFLPTSSHQNRGTRKRPPCARILSSLLQTVACSLSCRSEKPPCARSWF